MDKIQARAFGLNARKQLSEQERSVYDERIFQQVTAKLKDRSVVGCYVSYGKEADTRRIIEWCLDHQKTVAVPRTLSHTLEFRTIHSLNELKPGMKGILEPDESSPLISIQQIECMLVPLSAYDETGGRTGYGGGYYDSILKEVRYKVGIAYPVQQVAHIDTDPWDISLDEVITG